MKSKRNYKNFAINAKNIVLNSHKDIKKVYV